MANNLINKDLSSIIQVSRETIESLNEFKRILLENNKNFNLISSKDEEIINVRHIQDSAQIIDLIDKKSKKCIDLGSGAGFPGIVISIIITILGVTVLPNVIDWLFPKYVDAVPAIQIMSLGVVPGTIAILYSSKFLGMEKSKFVMITKLVSLGVLIGGFLYFGPIYGTIGLAWIIVTISAWEAIFLFTMDRTLKVS